MSPLIAALNEYAYNPATMQNFEPNSASDMSQDSFPFETYYPSPISYQLQSTHEWLNPPSPSLTPTPSTSPTTPSPHLSHAFLSSSTASNGFPSSWPVGPTSNASSTEVAMDGQEGLKDIQRLSDAKSRRRQQNRESQRAFRERKNKHIEQLEQTLADLQHRHEKLLQCFVSLTARVASEGGGNNNVGMEFLNEPLTSSTNASGKSNNF